MHKIPLNVDVKQYIIAVHAKNSYKNSVNASVGVQADVCIQLNP